MNSKFSNNFNQGQLKSKARIISNIYRKESRTQLSSFYFLCNVMCGFPSSGI